MRFWVSHTILLFFVCVVGFGGYFLFIAFLCRFLAFAKRADEMRLYSHMGVSTRHRQQTKAVTEAVTKSSKSGCLRA